MPLLPRGRVTSRTRRHRFARKSSRAHRDDEERMLLALREILDVDRQIAVRASVHVGHVFAGEIGPPYRRTYTVMGDAVNLAARVMSKASAQQLLATESVVSRSRTEFSNTALAPFLVKGKAKPVQALAVGRSRGRMEPEPSSIPLIGRTDEL